MDAQLRVARSQAGRPAKLGVGLVVAARGDQGPAQVDPQECVVGAQLARVPQVGRGGRGVSQLGVGAGSQAPTVGLIGRFGPGDDPPRFAEQDLQLGEVPPRDRQAQLPPPGHLAKAPRPPALGLLEPGPSLLVAAEPPRSHGQDGPVHRDGRPRRLDLQALAQLGLRALGLADPVEGHPRDEADPRLVRVRVDRRAGEALQAMGWPHGSRHQRGSPGQDRGDQGVLGAFEPGDLSLTQVPGACFIPAEGAEEDRVVPDLGLLGKTDGQGLFKPAGRFFPQADLGVIQRQRDQAPGQVGLKAGIIRPLGGQGFAVLQREPMRFEGGSPLAGQPTGVAQGRVGHRQRPTILRVAGVLAQQRLLDGEEFQVLRDDPIRPSWRAFRGDALRGPADEDVAKLRAPAEGFEVGEVCERPVVAMAGRQRVLDRLDCPIGQVFAVAVPETGLPHARQGEDPGLAEGDPVIGPPRGSRTRPGPARRGAGSRRACRSGRPRGRGRRERPRPRPGSRGRPAPRGGSVSQTPSDRSAVTREALHESALQSSSTSVARSRASWTRAC